MHEKRPEDRAPLDTRNTGDSTMDHGEDAVKKEKEPGRHDEGRKGSANRPVGTSTARDVTGVDPKDPITRPPTERSG